MRVASWNLNGLDTTDLDVRTEAALFRMLLGGPPEEVLLAGTPPPPPDVLLLQEVVERSFRAHLLPHLRASGYVVVPEAVPNRSYFEIIAVHGSHTVVDTHLVRFDATIYDRWLTGVTIDGGVQIFTGHMDSLADGSASRVRQLHQICEALGSGPALFAGDTNLRDSEVGDLGGITDAWEAVGRPNAHRWTWKGRRAKARYDRAYVAGMGIRGFKTFGGEPIGTGAPASDHLGIEVVVTP